MLKPRAFETFNEFIKRTIAYAEVYYNDKWHKVPIIEKTIHQSGAVEIRFSISPEQNTPTVITKVRLYDTGGEVWAENKTNLSITQAGGNAFYRYKLQITEKEV